MNFILDTHTLIWFLEINPQLSSLAKKTIENDSHKIFISIASIWEIAIKVQTGNLSLTKTLEEIILETEKLQIEILTIDTSHVLSLQKLPLHHRDPFDRIIIAQAITENFQIVSKDEQFDLYRAKRVW